MAKRTAQGAASAAPDQAPAPAPAPGVSEAPASAAPAPIQAPAPAAAPAAAADAAGASATDAAVAKSSDDAAAAPVRRGPTFPLNGVIRNNASLAFSEPITGAYLPGGGSATVTLHDEEHAEQVVDSLQYIAESNYLARDAIQFGPA